MIECHLQLNMKGKTECPFLMNKLFVRIKRLPLLSTVNLTLVEPKHILKTFYHLPISLVLLIHTFAYRCFRICLIWTKLYTELVCLKDIFLKNG